MAAGRCTVTSQRARPRWRRSRKAGDGNRRFGGPEALLRKVQDAMGPDRLPLLIAIDGADGIGKSSLASWLAWQLGAPAIYLDLYVIRGSNPLRWRSDELKPDCGIQNAA